MSISNWNLEVLVFVEGGKPEIPEKNHRSKARTNKKLNPHEMASTGIEPGSQRWEASASSKTAQYELYIYSCHLQELLFFVFHILIHCANHVTSPAVTSLFPLKLLLYITISTDAGNVVATATAELITRFSIILLLYYRSLASKQAVFFTTTVTSPGTTHSFTLIFCTIIHLCHETEQFPYIIVGFFVSVINSPR